MNAAEAKAWACGRCSKTYPHNEHGKRLAEGCCKCQGAAARARTARMADLDILAIEARARALKHTAADVLALVAEVRRLRDSLTAMHRRAQEAESIVDRSGIVEGRPQGKHGRSLGRALANYAAWKATQERDEARQRVLELEAVVDATWQTTGVAQRVDLNKLAAEVDEATARAVTAKAILDAIACAAHNWPAGGGRTYVAEQIPARVTALRATARREALEEAARECWAVSDELAATADMEDGAAQICAGRIEALKAREPTRG